MSFDLAVLSASRPLSADEARHVYERLCEEEDWSTLLEPDPRVEQFLAEIRDRWPDLDELPDEEVDDSPWSVGFDASPAHLGVSLVWSSVDEVVPAFLDAARRHGIYVYDPQEEALQLPTGERVAATPEPSETLTCAVCGRSIDPADMYGEDAESGKPMHLDCIP